MRISDVTCLKCGSLYLMAESVSVRASLGREDCAVCGNTLATWSDRRRKSFRLVLSPEHKYPPVPRRRASKKASSAAERGNSIQQLGRKPFPALSLDASGSSPPPKTSTSRADKSGRGLSKQDLQGPRGRRPEQVRSDVALLKVIEENPVRPANQEAGEVHLARR